MRRERGFTLLELIIVIGIIVLLAMILVPAFISERCPYLTCKCSSHLRALYIGLEEYLTKYGKGKGTFHQATGKNFWLTLRTYPNETKAIYPANDRKFDEFFVCPVTGHIGGPNEIDYRGPVYILPLIMHMNSSDIPIGSDKEENHGRKNKNINILYLNGAVKKRVVPGTPEWNDAAKYTVE